MKYTCLMFSEGGRDNNFILKLKELPKFKYHISNEKWDIYTDHASGSSPKTIIEKCRKFSIGKEYDIVICFVDLDKLKRDYPKNWEKEKAALENKYSKISVFWQYDNLEDEFARVLEKENYSKTEINRLASKEILKFVNSEYWKRLMSLIKAKERELDLN